MTLYEVVNSLKTIGLSQPTVRTAGDGSVYEFMNANPTMKYCTFFISQTSHRQDNDMDYYGFNLFFIDRLRDNLEGNRLQIQSIGKEVLRNIILTFCEKYECDYSLITYHPFTEKFVDETAGMYASIEFEMPIDAVCEEDYD